MLEIGVETRGQLRADTQTICETPEITQLLIGLAPAGDLAPSHSRTLSDELAGEELILSSVETHVNVAEVGQVVLSQTRQVEFSLAQAVALVSLQPRRVLALPISQAGESARLQPDVANSPAIAQICRAFRLAVLKIWQRGSDKQLISAIVLREHVVL